MNQNKTQIEMQMEEELLALQDLKYREFHCRLIPTVDPETVFGVRMPALRQLARKVQKTQAAEEFLAALPHHSYEANSLHGCLLSSMKDYARVIEELDRFLPYVDNWAVCDLINPNIFRKHLPQLLPEIRRWMASDHLYTVRFGIGMLMRYYLDEAFRPDYLDWVSGVHSREYYVNMMVAWYFATALAKQYAAALPYLEGRRLDPWTHNKAIQKAVESYRITDEQKRYLRTLKATTTRKGE